MLNEKRCKRCGNAGEFYAKEIKADGSFRYDAVCKECKKREIATRCASKQGRQYRTRAERTAHLRATRKPKELSERQKEIAAWKASGQWNWRRKCKRMASALSKPPACAWKARANAATSSLKMRTKKVKRSIIHRTPREWSTIINNVADTLEMQFETATTTVWWRRVQNAACLLHRRRRIKGPPLVTFGESLMTKDSNARPVDAS